MAIKVILAPKYILDKNWQITEKIPTKYPPQKMPSRRSVKHVVAFGTFAVKKPAKTKFAAGKATPLFGFGERIAPLKSKTPTSKEELGKLIKAVRIEVAEGADTKVIGADSRYEYLKTELGMNIVIPKGSIEELRFKVKLKTDGKVSHRVVAIDGFPKNIITEKEIIKGKIKVGVTKTFKFAAIAIGGVVGGFPGAAKGVTIGKIIPDFLDIEVNPWEFKIGSVKKVNVNFSGGLTSTPEWYFKKNGIKNDLRIALTIKKPKKVKKIYGEIEAAWKYNPGLFRTMKVQSEEKAITIY